MLDMCPRATLAADNLFLAMTLQSRCYENLCGVLTDK